MRKRLRHQSGRNNVGFLIYNGTCHEGVDFIPGAGAFEHIFGERAVTRMAEKDGEACSQPYREWYVESANKSSITSP